jgi:hypothetical protein
VRASTDAGFSVSAAPEKPESDHAELESLDGNTGIRELWCHILQHLYWIELAADEKTLLGVGADQPDRAQDKDKD